MSAITQYTCVTAPSFDELDVTAEELIQEGWQPFGSVSIAQQKVNTPEDYPHVLAQAFVKYA